MNEWKMHWHQQSNQFNAHIYFSISTLHKLWFYLFVFRFLLSLSFHFLFRSFYFLSLSFVRWLKKYRIHAIIILFQLNAKKKWERKIMNIKDTIIHAKHLCKCMQLFVSHFISFLWNKMGHIKKPILFQVKCLIISDYSSTWMKIQKIIFAKIHSTWEKVFFFNFDSRIKFIGKFN